MFTTGSEHQVPNRKRPKPASLSGSKSRSSNAPAIDISAHTKLLFALDRYPEAKRDVLKALTRR
jgi:hypothetical protein